MFPEFCYQPNPYTQSLELLIACLLAGAFIRFVILESLALLARRVKDVFINSRYKRTSGSLFLFIPLILFLLLFPSNRFDATRLERLLG